MARVQNNTTVTTPLVTTPAAPTSVWATAPNIAKNRVTSAITVDGIHIEAVELALIAEAVAKKLVAEYKDPTVKAVKDYINANKVPTVACGTVGQWKQYAGSTSEVLDEAALRTMLARLTIVDAAGVCRQMTPAEIETKVLESKVNKSTAASVRFNSNLNKDLIDKCSAAVVDAIKTTAKLKKI